MNAAAEFLVDQLKASLGRDDVYAVRQPRQADSETGVILPSIIWREDAREHTDLMSGPADAHVVFFELAIRSGSHAGAVNIATDLKHRLGASGRLTHLLADYDEPDDASQKRGKYFSRIWKWGSHHDR